MDAVRGVARLVDCGIDATLAALAPLVAGLPPGLEHDGAVAVLNGVLGDHLAESGNPLAIAMRLWHGGAPLMLEPDALREAVAEPKRKLLVLVHGSCRHHGQWGRRGRDDMGALARDAWRGAPPTPRRRRVTPGDASCGRWSASPRLTTAPRSSVLDEHRDPRGRFASGNDVRRTLRLPESVRCYAIAATRTRQPGAGPYASDGLVPVDSALGRHRRPELTLAFDDSWIAFGAGHVEVLERPELLAVVRSWLSGARTSSAGRHDAH